MGNPFRKRRSPDPAPAPPRCAVPGGCPVGSGCVGLAVPRVCELIARGVPGYLEHAHRTRGVFPPMAAIAAAAPRRRRPSWPRRALTFAWALWRHWRAGRPRASAAVLALRLAACAACPDLDQERRACNRCGCPVDRKARWATERCPANRWGELPIVAPDPPPCRRCDQ